MRKDFYRDINPFMVNKVNDVIRVGICMETDKIYSFTFSSKLTLTHAEPVKLFSSYIYCIQ